MNTEEFKYFVINSSETWYEGFSEQVRVHTEGQLSLSPVQRLIPLENNGVSTGFTIDTHGNIYVIDAQNCLIYKYIRVKDKYEQVQCIGGYGSQPGKFRFFSDSDKYRGHLALGKSTLYVADTFNNRIQAFYRHNYQIRFIIGNDGIINNNEKFKLTEPRDIVTDTNENIYVLDSSNKGNPRIQKFNRCGGFLKVIEHESLTHPTNLAMGNDNVLYVLNVNDSKPCVLKFSEKGGLVESIKVITDPGKKLTPSGIAVDKSNHIYIGEKGSESEHRIHVFDETDKYLGSFGSYQGSCSQLLTDSGGQIYGNFGESSGRAVFLLNGDGRHLPYGAYYSKSFDSTKKETRWHKIAIDANIDERTRIEVYYHISEFEVKGKTLNETQWTECFYSPRNEFYPTEGLIKQNAGRYLNLKIKLYGDEYHTPLVNQVLVYFPRLSYLRYLPPTFQEDDQGKDFMERFLSLFESFSSDMDERISGISKYFDPQAVNSEFLDWLSSWMAVSKDDNWPIDKKRVLVQNAYRFYKSRGTLKGLKEIVEFYTEKPAFIIEHFRLKTPVVLGANSTVGVTTVVGKAPTKMLILEESSTLGDFALTETDDPPEKPFGIDAFDFTIFVNTSVLKNKSQRQRTKTIIQEEKPAYTRCMIRTCNDSMTLGIHSIIGMETAVSRGFSPMQLGVTSFLGTKTFVGTSYPAKGTIGAHSRIGVETILN